MQDKETIAKLRAEIDSLRDRHHSAIRTLEQKVEMKDNLFKAIGEVRVKQHAAFAAFVNLQDEMYKLSQPIGAVHKAIHEVLATHKEYVDSLHTFDTRCLHEEIDLLCGQLANTEADVHLLEKELGWADSGSEI